MATNTYVALQTQTLSTDTATVTFSSIPQTYTDLVIVANQYVKFTSAGTAGVFLRFNGSSASYYSTTVLYGTGSSALSARNTNQTRGQVAQTYTSTATTSTKFNPAIIQIQNYSNTTTYKTTVGRGNAADGIVDANVMLWRGSTGSSTEAITSIEISTDGTTFYAGSTFSLYGIAAVGGDTTPKATGGVVTSDATYYYHTFAGSNTFTPLQSLTADVLVVAGGGGSGSARGGGGGAGGLLAFTSQSLTATGYPVIVGAGGAGGSSNGNDSRFGTLTLVKGGGKGGNSQGAGQAGGSGGGGGNDIGNFPKAGGSGTSGQGNAGGATVSTGYTSGGGGAGAAGQGNANGGAGVNTYSSWATVTGTGASGYYAGGGGGSSGSGFTPTGIGGAGGGGNGEYQNTGGQSGVALTGGGAGGTWDSLNYNNGGSGVVIVRYAK